MRSRSTRSDRAPMIGPETGRAAVRATATIPTSHGEPVSCKAVHEVIVISIHLARFQANVEIQRVRKPGLPSGANDSWMVPPGRRARVYADAMRTARAGRLEVIGHQYAPKRPPVRQGCNPHRG